MSEVQYGFLGGRDDPELIKRLLKGAEALIHAALHLGQLRFHHIDNIRSRHPRSENRSMWTPSRW